MGAMWADYSLGRPGGAALAAAGFTGVIRYVGISVSSKRLTAAEYTDLIGNGLSVLGVVESTISEADNGYDAGVADAQAALADIDVITSGQGLPFVFAVNDKPTYIQADVDYVRGFRDVFGGTTGAYGFTKFLAAIQIEGIASVYWQCGIQPTGDSGVHLWQRNGSDGAPTQVTVNGAVCDITDQLLPLTVPCITQTNFMLLEG
ncbi:MAG: glycoside hydrolase domain-containing protein [Candidatus Dormibacteria bacterium]